MKPTGHFRLHKGQIVVLFSVGLVVLCAIAAFTIDVGNLVLSRTRLQNAADAGALASMLELWEQRIAAADEASARLAADDEATRVVQLNYAEAGEGTVFGLWESSTFTPADAAVTTDAARVTAFRNGSAPGGPVGTFFAGLFDLAMVNQSAQATARLSHDAMVPFGVWEDDLVPPGQTLEMYNDSNPVPGCFGLLDFDGGDHSAEESKYWTRYGYDDFFDVDPAAGYVIVEGTTGLKTSVKDGVSYHVSEGDVVIACIYSDVWGLGSNAYFKIVGLVALVITGHEFTDVSEDDYDHIEAEVVATHFFSSGLSEGMRRDFMVLRLVE